MAGNFKNKFLTRVGLVVVVVPLCFIFPYALIVVLILAWVVFVDFMSPKIKSVPPPRARVDATPTDSDWLDLFVRDCESPAEEKFLQLMVKEFDLHPNKGKLLSPRISMEMQVKFHNYRFGFVLNNKYIVEIDGAAYHSSTEQVERDRIRDEFSVANGYSVLRIPASVVFNSPDETIRRVKDFAFKSTNSVSEKNTNPIFREKPVSRFLNDFSKGMSILAQGASNISQSINDASLKQVTTLDFRSAISHEQIFLEAMVSKVETEIRIMKLEPAQRKFHDEMYAKLTEGHVKKTLAEQYCWKAIILPGSVDNDGVQRQIEAGCAYDLAERNKRFEKLRARSAKDPIFAFLLNKYMQESNFPEMNLIYNCSSAKPSL